MGSRKSISRGSPSLELAAILRGRTGQIVRRFEREIHADSRRPRSGAARACRAWMDDLLYELKSADGDWCKSDLGSATAIHSNEAIDELLIAFCVLPEIILAEAAAAARRPPGTAQRRVLRVALTRAARRAVIAGIDRHAQSIRNQAIFQKSILDRFSHELHGGLNGVLTMLAVVKEQLGAYPLPGGLTNDMDVLSRQIMAVVEKADHYLEQNEIVASASGATMIKSTPEPVMVKDLAPAKRRRARS